MTLDFDPSGDFAVFDGAQSVVYTTIAGATATVSGATTRALPRGQLQLADQLADDDVVRGFSLPVANLNGIAPYPGDRLLDASGTPWRVVSAELCTISTRWRCVCRQEK